MPYFGSSIYLIWSSEAIAILTQMFKALLFSLSVSPLSSKLSSANWKMLDTVLKMFVLLAISSKLSKVNLESASCYLKSSQRVSWSIRVIFLVFSKQKFGYKHCYNKFKMYCTFSVRLRFSSLNLGAKLAALTISSSWQVLESKSPLLGKCHYSELSWLLPPSYSASYWGLIVF